MPPLSRNLQWSSSEVPSTVFNEECTNWSKVTSSTRVIWSTTKLHELSARWRTSALASFTDRLLVCPFHMRPFACCWPRSPISAVLQLFLSSPKSVLKFAAIRTLAKLAQTHPNAVQTCNLDMEKLINDDNRSVATFAITTLLKTGNEASVDRLMKQISQFMSEISDEFKVIVVNAIRALCLKFPAKQSVMLNFLSGVLRDEGGYDFKRSVVEAIFDMIKFISDSKEAGTSKNSTAKQDWDWHFRSLFSPCSTLRIHRRLRVHETLGSNPSLARSRGTQDSPTLEIHSIHLQPSHPRKRYRPSGRRLVLGQVWSQRSGSSSQAKYQSFTHQVSFFLITSAGSHHWRLVL